MPKKTALPVMGGRKCVLCFPPLQQPEHRNQIQRDKKEYRPFGPRHNKVRLGYRLPGHVIGQNMLEEPQNSIFQEPQKKRKQEGEGIGEKHQQKAGPLFFHIVQKSPAYTTIHIK